MRVEARIRLGVPEIEPGCLRLIFERTKIKPNLGRLLTFRNFPPGHIHVERVHSHEQQAVLVMVYERVQRVQSSFLKRMTVGFHGRVRLSGYQGVDNVLIGDTIYLDGSRIPTPVEGTVVYREVRALTSGSSLKLR